MTSTSNKRHRRFGESCRSIKRLAVSPRGDGEVGTRDKTIHRQDEN